MVNVNEVVASVVDSVKAEGDELVQFEVLKEIISKLTEAKKSLKDKADVIAETKKKEIAEEKKAKKSAENEDAKEVVLSFFKVGDIVTWTNTSKNIFSGKIVKVNDKTLRIERNKDDVEKYGYKLAKDGKSYANVPYSNIQIEVDDSVETEEVANA